MQLLGRLYHEYIVVNYAKIESGRLNSLNSNQKLIRSELYKGVHEAIRADSNATTSDIGKPTILPSSFSGGPRKMEQLFQDAMECIRIYGKPDLFIIFTINSK